MPMLMQPLQVAGSLAHTVMNMVLPGKCRLCRRFTVNAPATLAALNFGARPVPQMALFKVLVHNLCRHCAGKFKTVSAAACPRCGCEPENGVCINCQKHPLYYVDRCMSLLCYDSDIGPVIKRFKYGGDLYVNRFLSQCLLAGLTLNAPKGVFYDFIAVVPLHPKKQRARKFNQNERLLQYWRRLGFKNIDCLCKSALEQKLLIRSKHTRPQAGLDAAARALNVSGAFEVKDRRVLNGLNILLVDDIVTTGATVENCAKALKTQGAARVDVISIARTMPHRNPDHLMEI